MGDNLNEQINRGFRVVAVHPENFAVTVHQVADTGITISGARDWFPDTQVEMWQLVVDHRYDA